MGLAHQVQAQGASGTSGAAADTKKKGSKKAAEKDAGAAGEAEGEEEQEEGNAGTEEEGKRAEGGEGEQGKKHGGDMLTSSPEYLLVYLLHVLAHSNGWPDSPSTAARKDLDPFVR